MKAGKVRRVINSIIQIAALIFVIIWLIIYIKAYIKENSHESFEANGVKFVCSIEELPEECDSLYIRPFSDKKRAVANSEYWEKNSCCLLVDKGLDDEALKAIAAHSPSKLVINMVGVENIDPLSYSKGLKHLWINTSFSEENEKFKEPVFGGDFGDLEELYIYDNINSVGDIGKISTLKQLMITGENVKELTGFQNLKALETLDISHTSVKDISCLEQCKNMRELKINYTNVSDISALKNMDKLEVFQAQSTYEHNDVNVVRDISALADKPNLKKVDLYGTDVSDISPLSENKALEKAELSYTHLSDPTPLIGLPALMDTGFYDCPLDREKAEMFFDWYGNIEDRDVYYCMAKYNE